MCSKYICEDCDYTTTRLYDLERHNKSIKHISIQKKCDNKSASAYKNEQNNANINDKEYCCKYCDKKFTSKTSMYRHIRTVCGTTMNNTQSEIIELRQQVNKLVDTLKTTADTANKNADTANKNADTANIATKAHKKTISAMHYATKNFTKAPNIKLLEKDVAIGLLTYTETEKRSVGDWLVFYHEKNTIHEFIGNMIIKAYKKEDPAEQTFWATDTSRLSFIVMQLFEESGDSEWVSDKSGSKIKKLIIDPLLKQIKIKLLDYKKTCAEQISGNHNKLIEYIKKDTHIDEIIYNINEKILEKDILKYIAPCFGINLKLTTIEKCKCVKCDKKFNESDGDYFKTKFFCDHCAEKILNGN